MFKSKKGQIEIVGLLVIVLMITFIMLFAVKSFLTAKPSDLSDTKKENLAASLISAMLNTHSGCTTDTKVKDLVTDCGKWNIIGTTDLICSDGSNSCTYVNRTLRSMLNYTLLNWSMPYELIVTAPDNPGTYLIHNIGGNLSRSKTGETAIQPLPVGRGYGNMEVRLCLGGCPDI